MAPEQARGLEVDGRADLFALGLVLYYCLTGEPLYGAEAGYDLLVKAASGPGPLELGKLASLPLPFPTVLYRVLAARPEARYPSAFAFAEVLVPLVQGGALRMAELMTELFGEELGTEQQHLAASSAGRLGGGGRGADGRLADSAPRSRRGSDDE
jgi:serine/threonine protein kinase